jgi:hypothetical protein
MRKTVCAALLAIAVLLILVGVLSGQYLNVLAKATKVCLECVGIG